jgi:hypothetical protein
MRYFFDDTTSDKTNERRRDEVKERSDGKKIGYIA